MCANGSQAILNAAAKEAAERGESRQSQTFAREAYECADAMLTARKERNGDE